MSRILPHAYEKLYGEEGVAMKGHYSRQKLPVYDDQNDVLNYASFYIRAASLEVEDTYESYGLLLLLQEAGGLWTGLASLAASTLFLFFCCCRLAGKLRPGDSSETDYNDMHPAE